ncbi:pyridoxal 5'-phosphate synthase-like subunit PDX1.2 [Aristolochia californica]|uniref:pyridoxal 5'-phosphate synthase-like subunit PDX1.2 n=1 Tax=Aristolochia californica TaxID=171875 RepID=UPI0035E05D9C
MSDDGVLAVYRGSTNSVVTGRGGSEKTPFSIKAGRAQALRGGVIVEVSSPEHAKIAEEAGASAVAVIDPPKRGIGRMMDPAAIKEIKGAVSIPIVAKARIGHFVEAQILESIGVDYVDESETLAPADDQHYINKHNFRVPFFCGCRDLGEALRRIREGAAAFRTVENVSTEGNIAETVRAIRSVTGEIRQLSSMDDDEVFAFAKRISAPYDLVAQTKQMGRLPVVIFAAGGLVTPADAALMMQLGCDGVFVGSELFNGPDGYERVRGIVRAVREYNDAHALAEASCRTNLPDGIIDQLARGGIL